MAKYAKGTSVSVEKSKIEIERVLRKYGASGFFSAWDGDEAHLGFRIEGRVIKMQILLPPRDIFLHTATGKERLDNVVDKHWEQSCRQHWRALLLVIKAKLEAVECGISTIEREFLADVVLPDGKTLGSWIGPQLEAAFTGKKMPKLLKGI